MSDKNNRKSVLLQSFETIRKFDELGEYNQTTIHHYTSANAILNILNEDKIKLWFTQYDSLNDVNERTESLQCLIKYCENKFNEGIISDELLNKIKDIKLSDDITVLREVDSPPLLVDGKTFEKYREACQEECFTYLCCFSLNPDSLAMWNYYSKSNNYDGYSIGVSKHEFLKEPKNANEYRLYLKKVIYSNDEKTKLFDEYILPLLRLYDDANISDRINIINAITIAINKAQYIFKNEHFKHEEEVRVILQASTKFVSDDMVSKRNYRIGNGYVIPYVEVFIDKTELNKIITAPLFEQDLAINNLSSMLSDRGYPKVEIEPSSVPIRF